MTVIANGDGVGLSTLVKKAPVNPSNQTVFRKSGANANLAYQSNGVVHYFDLWISSITQDHALNGNIVQGRYNNHYYTTAYTVGDFQMMLAFNGQQDLQDFGEFIRDHQTLLMAHTGGFDLTVAQNEQSTKFKKLLQFHIPSESVLVRGFCSNFHVTRKGFAEPIPTYQFNFTPVWDNISVDFTISQKIIGWMPAANTEVGMASDTPGASKLKSPSAKTSTSAGSSSNPNARKSSQPSTLSPSSGVAGASAGASAGTAAGVPYDPASGGQGPLGSATNPYSPFDPNAPTVSA